MLYCKEKRSNKANRKVSKYFDKKGVVKKELEECLIWIENDFSSKINHFEKLIYFKLSNEFMTRKKSRHTQNELKNRNYVKSLYNKVIFENRFYVAKRIKQDGIYYYEVYDMHRFIITLIYAYKVGKIKEFIDVPDVFFVVKQLKATGIEPYIT